MQTVRMTDEICFTTKMRIHFIYQNIIKRMQQSAPLQKWSDHIYNTLFAQKNQDACFDMRPARGIVVNSVAGRGVLNSLGKEGAFFVGFTSPRLWPSTPYENGLAVECSNNFTPFSPSLVLRDHPVWYGLRDEIIAYNNKIKSILDERTALETSLKRICKNYSTVNEAVAAWPALRYLLLWKLQIHDLPFDGTPKPLPENVDVDSLTSVVARLKLMEV